MPSEAPPSKIFIYEFEVCSPASQALAFLLSRCVKTLYLLFFLSSSTGKSRSAFLIIKSGKDENNSRSENILKLTGPN